MDRRKELGILRFNLWLQALTDSSARVQILARLAAGHLADWRAVGHGVRELRIHSGPGHRVYFIRVATRIVLLTGGDKSSQKQDISHAQTLAAALLKDDRDED